MLAKGFSDEALKHMRLVSTAFAEWISGLPRNWTQTHVPVSLGSEWQPSGPRLQSLCLFSGVGGMTLGLRPYHVVKAYCEIKPEAQAVLEARMRDGCLERAPIFADVTKLCGHHLGPIDVVTAGFPCQGNSCAGKMQGLSDPRTALFGEVLRIIDEMMPRPKAVFLENVGHIRRKKMTSVWGHVISSLERRGYVIKFVTFCA